MATRGGRTIAALAHRRNQKVADVRTNPYHLLQVVDPQPPTPGTPTSPTSLSPSVVINSQLQEARRITSDLEQIVKVRTTFFNEALEALKNYVPSAIDRMGDTEKGEKQKDGKAFEMILARMDENKQEMSNMSGKIDGLATRIGNVELNVNTILTKRKPVPANPAIQPQKETATATPSAPPPTAAVAQVVQVPVTTGASNITDDPWTDEDEEEEDAEAGDGQDEWTRVVRGTSRTTKRLLPRLGSDMETLRLGGYQPSKQEIRRYNHRRTEVLREVDTAVRGFDELERNQMPSRSAWDGHLPRKRRETIDKLYAKIEGMQNPATRKVDRWRKETIDNPGWNIFVQPNYYQLLQEELAKDPPPNINTPHLKKRFKLVSLMKRELLIGPFRQEDWSREDEKAGGMKNRPSYMLQLLCDHLSWFLDMSEEQLSQLKIVAIKPVEDSMASLYPGQLRVTFLTKQMADTVLMSHAQTRGQFAKRSSKVRVMVADEFMMRYSQLAAAATLKRNSFNSESGTARMLTFISYSAGSLEIVEYKTNLKRPVWQLMNTPRSVTASMWEDRFEYKRGVKLEPYQKRIIEKREAKKVDFGTRMEGKWVMPTIKPAPDNSAVIRNRSFMDSSTMSTTGDEANNKKQKTGSRTSEHSDDSDIYDDMNELPETRSVFESLRNGNDDIIESGCNLSISFMQPQMMDEDSHGAHNDDTEHDAANYVYDRSEKLPIDPEALINDNMHVLVDDFIQNEENVDICTDVQSLVDVDVTLAEPESTQDDSFPPTLSPISSVITAQPLVTTDNIDQVYMKNGEYSVENESKTRKLEMRIKLPTSVMLTLDPVIAHLLGGVADSFTIFDKIVRVEEFKKSDKIIRFAEIDKCGVIKGKDAFIKVTPEMIIIWSATGAQIRDRNIVHLIWEEILEKLINSIMKKQDQAETDDDTEGPCAHPKCGKTAYLRCSICKRFIHGDKKCSNRGLCKSFCRFEGKAAFISDPVLLATQLKSTFLQNAERRDKNTEIQNLKSVIRQEAAKSKPATDSSAVIVPGEITDKITKKRNNKGTVPLDIRKLLDITDKDIEEECSERDPENDFDKYFPTGWTRWVDMRKDKRLKNLFFLEDTVRDGNCFYDSIGKVMVVEKDYSLPADPQKLREKVVSQFHGLDALNDWIDAWYQGNRSRKNEIVRTHMRSGTFTDNSGFVIRCVAEVIKREIRIISDEYFTDSTDPNWYKSFKPVESELVNKHPIWVGYSLAGQHFRGMFLKNRYRGLVQGEEEEKERREAREAGEIRENVEKEKSETGDQVPAPGQALTAASDKVSLPVKKRKFRQKCTPEQLDERRRRREAAKSDLQMKMEAAQTHIVNLTRSIGQGEEKMQLLQEKIDTYELYCNSLESKNLRLQAALDKAGIDDPETSPAELAFTPRDSANVIKIKHDVDNMLVAIKQLTTKVHELHLPRTPIEKSSVSGITTAAARLQNGDNPASPSVLSFEQKRRLFGADISQPQEMGGNPSAQPPL